MISPGIIRQAIKDRVDSRIYARGLNYFKFGNVKNWSVEEDDEKGVIVISGEVSGTRNYVATLEFNIKKEIVTVMNCNCPYGSSCKHAVAIGLAFIDHLKKHPDIVKGGCADEPEIAPERLAEFSKLLKDLLYSDPELIQEIIQKLPKPDAYNKGGKPSAPRIKSTFREIPFIAQNYYITLNTYDNYAPELCEKGYSSYRPGIDEILKRKGLTVAQQELLQYIKDQESGYGQSKILDYYRLFSLLIESGLPVYLNYYSYNTRHVNININPEPLKVDIVYEPSSMAYDESKVRHDFFLRMPKEYWNTKNMWQDSPLYVNGPYLIRNNYDHNSIELYSITPLLAGILSRLTPIYDYQNRGKKIKYYEVSLTGAEIAEFDRLKEEISNSFELTSPLLGLTSQPVTEKPKKRIVIDFDSQAQTLQVSPVIDYGIYRQDISESVYISRQRKGDIISRRDCFEDHGTHIINVSGNVIYHIEIDKNQEIEFYTELASKANELGFTKTLKCQRKGNRQVSEYLSNIWPELSLQGYEIIFSKDEIPFEQAFFRADFLADMSEDNDWLYFDADFYCGSEKITLEKLLSFLESGEPFWKKEDGTLVKIANNQELERLARLLQSFRAREEGGFEGRLHHTSELEYVMTSSPHYNLKRAKSFEQFLNQVQDGKPVKEVYLSDEINKILRPYQKAGVEWMYFLRSYRFAGILADDMGLGKTIQTLTILDKEKVPGKPSLIICPKTLLYNWQEEAEKFFPELKVLIYDGNKGVRESLRQDIFNHDLIISSYPTLKQDGEFFSNPNTKFNYVVIDEAQFIKNHATKNAQVVKKLNADYRLALTGTPFENSVSEIWSIYDFLMPGFLGSYERFAKNFHNPIMDAGDRQALEHLRKKVEPFMLRRTKSEVLKELPPKIEQLSQCHLSEAQNILYQQILSEVRSNVLGVVEQKGFKSAQIHILAGLTKLRQACNHPALLVKDKDFHKYESAKLDMCLELVEEVIKSSRKVLIFSQFTQMLDIVSSALEERNIPYLYLSGKTKNRQDLTHRFNDDPDMPVFLISLKAGGTGLNLTSADTVIIFDPWWNPSVENQAIDRTHRIGQKKVVNVYRLLTSGTIEEKIQELKERKQKLFNALVGESGDMFKKLTWDEVKDLFAD